ncbi:hypothetical protein CROQUDRAFT_671776 [Cronartium quercuum f. sp. fusiforme G11]|uniref:Uncharacterized protein n=1 Tax=Cronartium quercuum f. sp. fusiforme G11 TaxID=708437 RepID=A0A9P6TAP0_9BASI|nr:hypothetical protein CROQUDRAFT_671776 [Cronartium quercuum f. sp. fusiforme G11]
MSFWTWAIIAGQSLISMVGLTFFALINFTHTPMNQALAGQGQKSPRSMAYTITAIATVFSAMTTFFFSRSLVLFLTSYSNRPTSLSSFLCMSSLSRGAIVFSNKQLKWTALSIMALILLNSLTASFATIFSPTPMLIKVPIMGRDFALDGQLFNEALGLPNNSKAYPQLTPSQLALNNRGAAVFQSVSLTTAYATASRELGYPGVIGYLGTTLNSSTGGIMPAIPEQFDHLKSNPQIDSTSQFGDLRPHFRFAKAGFKPSRDLVSNYTTFQHGFTADVNCELLPEPNSNRTDQPSLVMRLERTLILPDNSSIDFWRTFSRCPLRPTKNSTQLLRKTGNMLVGQTCVDQDLAGASVPGSRLLLLAGQGPRYNSFIGKPRVCQFTPFFTKVEVQYTSSVNITRVISKTPVNTTTSNVAKLMYGGLLDAIALYASDVRNKVAEDIFSLFGLVADLSIPNDALLNKILENYFRGLIEGRATLIRTPPISLVTQGGLIATSLDELTTAWTSEYHGSWVYESLGWHPDADKLRSSIIGLVPILLVTFSSIVLSLFSWTCLRRSRQHTEEAFDPNNLMSLLKAGRDGSVVEKLASPVGDSEPAQVDMKIQLQRNKSHWELRPVITS